MSTRIHVIRITETCTAMALAVGAISVTYSQYTTVQNITASARTWRSWTYAPNQSNGSASTTASYTIRCGFTRTDARISAPTRTRSGAPDVHTFTSAARTAAVSTSHNGNAIAAGARRVSARSEWLWNGFASSRSACRSINGTNAAYAA